MASFGVARLAHHLAADEHDRVGAEHDAIGVVREGRLGLFPRQPADVIAGRLELQRSTRRRRPGTTSNGMPAAVSSSARRGEEEARISAQPVAANLAS